VRKISFPIVTLPGAPPNTYFLGIIVDPANTIREIREIGQPPSTELSPAVVVGPPITNLPPAGLVSAPASPANVFPIPPFGLIPIFSSSASTVTQSSTGGGISAAAANATLRLLPRARRFAALPPVNIHVPQGAVVTQPGTLRTVKVGHS
jgi:hypothetical protein